MVATSSISVSTSRRQGGRAMLPALDLRRAAAIVAELTTTPATRLRKSVSHEYIEHALALFASSTDFCVFDLETTDKLASKHEKGMAHPAGTPSGKTMQLAARRYRWDHAAGRAVLIAQMNVLVNDPDIVAGTGPGGSGCCLNEGAYNTHRISIADLRKRGILPQATWTQFLRLASGAVLMGHNAIGFDIALANRDLARLGSRAVLDDRRAIDTLLIARHVYDLKSYRLRDLANFLGVRTDPALDHNALGDIDTTWKIWLAMLPALRTYRARFIVGNPDQYKRALGKLGDAWAKAS